MITWSIPGKQENPLSKIIVGDVIGIEMDFLEAPQLPCCKFYHNGVFLDKKQFRFCPLKLYYPLVILSEGNDYMQISAFPLESSHTDIFFE